MKSKAEEIRRETKGNYFCSWHTRKRRKSESKKLKRVQMKVNEKVRDGHTLKAE